MEYQRGQQYVVTTHQLLNNQQLVPQQPERINTDNQILKVVMIYTIY